MTCSSVCMLGSEGSHHEDHLRATRSRGITSLRPPHLISEVRSLLVLLHLRVTGEVSVLF